jgi:chromatin-remodeling ATPase INO80
MIRHSYSGYEHTSERKEHFHEDNDDALQGSFVPESFDLTSHGNGKRPASVAASDTSSLDLPPRRDSGPVHKRRRLDESVDLQSSPSPSVSNGISLLADTQSEPRINEYTHAEDSNVKTSRKKTAYKKKAPLEQEIVAASHPSSISDVTPSVSRPASPTPTVTSVVYDLDESVPPMKKAKKMDDNTIVKRVKALEDAQKKVWTNIARREAAKVLCRLSLYALILTGLQGYKYQLMCWQNRQMIVERVAKLASTQARRPFLKTPKSSKDVQTKAKRLMREMQVFWKKNEKEERDVRKREHKVAMDRLKMEEEKREAARQARKLEFLISQTELYSHFVGNKLKSMSLVFLVGSFLVS